MGRSRRARTLLCLAMGSALIARGADAGVVFSDDFEGDVASIVSRWGNGTSSGISFANDVPGEHGKSPSSSTQASGQPPISFTNCRSTIARLYYRYYVKYEGTDYHHTGGMIGGYEPPTSYPQGDAGLKGIRPNGDRLLDVNFESQSNIDWISTTTGSTCRVPTNQGLYYGRNLIQDLKSPVPNQWTCVELMVSLNTPATASNGELIVWINGAEVANFRPGAPNGYWDTLGNWRMRASSPAFGGFRGGTRRRWDSTG